MTSSTTRTVHASPCAGNWPGDPEYRLAFADRVQKHCFGDGVPHRGGECTTVAAAGRRSGTALDRGIRTMGRVPAGSSPLSMIGLPKESTTERVLPETHPGASPATAHGGTLPGCACARIQNGPKSGGRTGTPCVASPDRTRNAHHLHHTRWDRSRIPGSGEPSSRHRNARKTSTSGPRRLSGREPVRVLSEAPWSNSDRPRPSKTRPGEPEPLPLRSFHPARISPSA